jgi:hypothetical protein
VIDEQSHRRCGDQGLLYSSRHGFLPGFCNAVWSTLSHA